MFIIGAFVVVGILTALELRYGAKLDRNRLLNLEVWLLQIALSAALLPLIAFSVGTSLIAGSPLWAGLVLFFLVADLGEYLFHRAQHSIPWLWRMHSLHHSDPDMNATTTARHFWGDQFIKAVTIWPAAIFIVRPTPGIFLAYSAASLWNYVAHSGLPLSFGKLSWLLNSPAYHRRHHSILPEHYNSNFSGLFPIWDVIAGSYYRPDGMPPTGLSVKPERLSDIFTWPIRKSARQ